MLFKIWKEVTEAVVQATVYGNAHRQGVGAWSRRVARDPTPSGCPAADGPRQGNWGCSGARPDRTTWRIWPAPPVSAQSEADCGLLLARNASHACKAIMPQQDRSMY